MNEKAINKHVFKHQRFDLLYSNEQCLCLQRPCVSGTFSSSGSALSNTAPVIGLHVYHVTVAQARDALRLLVFSGHPAAVFSP